MYYFWYCSSQYFDVPLISTDHTILHLDIILYYKCPSLLAKKPQQSGTVRILNSGRLTNQTDTSTEIDKIKQFNIYEMH
jgi:hypothetical protein